MTVSQTNVGCLVAKVAMGREGKMFQNRIESHISKCGVEWTNNRLKAIWNAALCLRSGEVEKAKVLYQENSIAYHKDTLIPKGPEGIPVGRFVNAQRPSVIKRQAAVLRYYCSLRLDHVSDKQRNKALTAIGGPTSSNLSPEQLRQKGAEMATYVLNRHPERRKKVERLSLDSRPASSFERDGSQLKSTSKYYSRNRVPRDLRGVPYSSMAMSFMTEPWVPDIISEVTPCKEMRDFITKGWLEEHPQRYAGKITFLQEQGCKARVVCQPSAWLQLAFVPLHKRVAQQAELLFPHESCVKNQVSGAYALMRHLADGHEVFCTDLSSATDRFPREVSIGILEALGHQGYAEALSQVCDMPFVCSESPDGEIKYTVGQPMGLYGSFPLFHISNMIVAEVARYRAFLERTDGIRDNLVAFADGSYFKTVGDDIIFSDGCIASHYRSMMNDFGVGISESKSFRGNVGEFAGFIGVKTNTGSVVFRPYKVPDKNLNNAIQFLDAMGSKVTKVSPYWERQFRLFERTISSRDLALSPLVPGEDPGYQSSANRGDNRTIINMCQVLAMNTDDALPDLSGNTRINRIPLFQERRMFDFYGYNPDELQREEKSRVEPMRNTNKTLRSDPLIQEAKQVESDPSYKPVRIVPTSRREETPSSEVEEVRQPPEPTPSGKSISDRRQRLLKNIGNVLRQQLSRVPTAPYQTHKPNKVSVPVDTTSAVEPTDVGLEYHIPHEVILDKDTSCGTTKVDACGLDNDEDHCLPSLEDALADLDPPEDLTLSDEDLLGLNPSLEIQR